MNSVVGTKIYYLLLHFSVLGWSVNNAVEPNKKMQNAKSLLGKRTLRVCLDTAYFTETEKLLLKWKWKLFE